MKKFILTTGLIILLINFIFYLILEFYPLSALISSQISILISILIVYHVAASSLPDGYKIGLKYGLKLSGIVRFILALFIIVPLTNSILFLAFIIVIALEVFIILSMKFVSSYSKEKK